MNLLDQGNKQNEIQDDPNKDYFAELTGPGGKYDRTKYQSDEDMYKAMAKGKYLADQMVDFKNAEYDKLKNDYLEIDSKYKASASLQEMIDQIRKEGNTDNNGNNNLQPDKVLDKPAMSEDELRNFFQQNLSAYERQKQEEANYKTVEAKLKESLGVNYASALKQQANELGMSDEDVNALAKRSPQAFFRMFGISEQRQQNDSFQAPPRNQRNDNFAPTSNKRTWSYYEKLRKENYPEYIAGKTQNQMFQDMQELGEAFKDGNYKSLERL